jgi:DnaK suppressor protein
MKTENTDESTRDFYYEVGAKLMAERESVRAALQADAGDVESLRSEWQERDSASERNARDVEWKQLEGLYQRLRHIDEALDRLMDGRYGLCRECGETIEQRRLVADPASTTCLACQQTSESDIGTRRAFYEIE